MTRHAAYTGSNHGGLFSPRPAKRDAATPSTGNRKGTTESRLRSARSSRVWNRSAQNFCSSSHPAGLCTEHTPNRRITPRIPGTETFETFACHFLAPGADLLCRVPPPGPRPPAAGRLRGARGSRQHVGGAALPGGSQAAREVASMLPFTGRHHAFPFRLAADTVAFC